MRIYHIGEGDRTPSGGNIIAWKVSKQLMKISSSIFALLIWSVLGVNLARAAGSAELPERYRDFKIYTTSQPDAADPGRILLTIQLRNEGKKPLATKIHLDPQPRAGFNGGDYQNQLKAGANTEWKVDARPPADLRYEVLKGDITFGKTRARELYIALQGPDPDTYKAEDDYKNIAKLTTRATAVGTHAPSIPGTVAPSINSRLKPLLTLAANGKSTYRIVVEPMPRGATGADLSLDDWRKQKLRPSEEHLIQAVADLQRCIRLMSGATLPITADAAAAGPAIRLTIDTKRPWTHDSYQVKTDAQGNVNIRAGDLSGLHQAVYGLLTDHLDCHWFQPGELGEEIPRPADKTVVIGQLDEERKPTFFSVNGMSWSAHRDWDVRNRCYINRGRMTFGHAWIGLVQPSEESYKEHPDWWARDREGKIRKFETGWSHTNFCTTSPEVIEMVAKKINAQLNDPQAIVASLDPNDYAPMCLCDRCLALDAKYGVTNQNGEFVTDRLLHFSQEIYNRLEPQNREKFLGMLVYGYQQPLPKSAVPHRHHVGLVCAFDPIYDHTRPFTDPTDGQGGEFYKLIAGWGKILPQFGFYDYYGHWDIFGPWGQVQKMREDLPAFRDLGGSFLMIEAQPNFSIHGLNLYIASRLACDVDADVDSLLDEFFTKYYGPAATPMRRYWMTIERYYALTRPGGHAAQRVNANPAMWPELDQLLKVAETSVAGADQRFKDRVAFNRDGFELGRRQHEFTERLATPPANIDVKQSLAEIDAGMKWLHSRREKYSTPTGYWPTFLASYFYPEIENRVGEAKKKLEALATAQG